VTVEPATAESRTSRGTPVPAVRDTGVGVSDDRFVVDATLQCPECGHEWDVSF